MASSFLIKMFSANYLLLLALYLSSFRVFALPFEPVKRDGVKAISLGFDVLKTQTNVTLVAADATKRDDQIITLKDESGWYAATVKIGSNEDELQVTLDTGSSDLWVIQKDAECTLTGDDAGTCWKYGSFDQTTSTTYNQLSDVFRIGYVDGSGAYGYYAKDTVKVDDITLDQFEFGSVDSASSQFGVFGIGFASLEASSSYDNLPVVLKNKGLIDKVGYSLYLNERGQTGTVLFGAKDTAKYTGDLIKLPFQSSTRLSVDFEGFSYNGETFSLSEADQPVLDSGTTLTYLPNEVTDPLAKALGAQGSQYEVDCDYQAPHPVSFNFNGGSIEVHNEDLVAQSITGQCYLTIRPASEASDNIIIGDNFLRSAYVVYNLEDGYAEVGQVKFTSDSSLAPL